MSGLLLIGTATYWLRLSRHVEPTSERPAIRVHRFRSAAGFTGLAFGLLGVTLLWLAFVSLP